MYEFNPKHFNPLKLLKFIEIKSCFSLCFMSETTLLATSFLGDCIHKYTREDSTTLEWKLDKEFKVLDPTGIRCIGSNVYFLSNFRNLYLTNEDLENPQLLHDNGNNYCE